uniref:Partial AB-hydrolase lipase domain-containing protein n=1 Tax=Gopherus evgoodei TaxID=1825980 RepID=A0A8C4W2I1_9SAUR
YGLHVRMDSRQLLLGAVGSGRGKGSAFLVPHFAYSLQDSWILYRGYPSEEYEVLTADGYYLSMNRIPHGKGNPRDTGPKLVVLLLHGLLLDGSNWITNLPNNSLGFILADAGNTWSRKHQNLSIDQEEFWDFSFHEMAMYDLPALVDFILQKNGQQNLYYIGYFQGCTIALIAFSTMPQLGQNIKIFFALAPAYTLKKSKAPLTQLSFFPTEILRVLLCNNIFFLQSRADVYAASFPDYASVKNVIHWGQVELPTFIYMILNYLLPAQTTPPFYKIEDMTVQTALWNGGCDSATSPQDTVDLLSQITSLIFYKYFPDWTHSDFIWGLDATQRMYTEILELMGKHP